MFREESLSNSREGWVRELRLLRFFGVHGELKIERAFEVLEVSQDNPS